MSNLERGVDLGINLFFCVFGVEVLEKFQLQKWELHLSGIFSEDCDEVVVD